MTYILEENSFYEFYSRLSGGFNQDPEIYFSQWNEIHRKISEISFINLVCYDATEQERKDDYIKTLNYFAEAYGYALKSTASDSIDCIAEKLLKLAKILRSEDDFISSDDLLSTVRDSDKSIFIAICEEASSETKSFNNSSIEHIIGLLISLSHYYEDVASTERDINYISSNKEFIIKAFSGRNIKLLNNQHDLKAIGKILSKNLGYQTRKGLACRSISKLIDVLISKNSTSLEPKISSHIKGYAFEVEIASIYRSLGYEVMLTSYTGDFGIDIIAISNLEKIGIQCKNLASAVGVDAIMQAYSGGKYYDCNRYCVISTQGYTDSAVELARKLGVEILTHRKTG